MLAAMAPLLGGCDQSQPASAAVAMPEPAPDVSIVTVKPQPRAIVRELPGRIAPIRRADVRPRVSGIIVERLFRQGSEVREGDPLYRIDPRPFEVEVQANEAALAKAQATYERAVQQARRMNYLSKERAAPEIENEKAIAAEKEAAANVEARKADLARAKLSLRALASHLGRSDQTRRLWADCGRRQQGDHGAEQAMAMRGAACSAGSTACLAPGATAIHGWCRARSSAPAV
jgi:membrane fusion protein (multidrug efflux system)